MKNHLIAITICSISSASFSNSVSSYIFSTKNPDIEIGHIRFEDTAKGLMIYPHLSNLSPGIHGMHIHQYPNCSQAGNAAGSHFDPQQTLSHQGPYKHGHLGDLPALTVNQDGSASLPVLAPHLRIKDLQNHAIIIHEQGDNYSDQPELGGGGKRIACGIIKE